MNETEAAALFELLAMLIMSPRTGLLILLLLAAAVSDWRSHRIPNWLTFGGMLCGLAINAFSPTAPHAGFVWALGGLALGLFSLLPMYALRILGAGDVKLMAMVGAFLGMFDTFHALMFSLVVGGLAALVFALSHRALGRMFANVRQILYSFAFAAATATRPTAGMSLAKSVGRLPYGVSIGIGTVAYLVTKQLGYL